MKSRKRISKRIIWAVFGFVLVGVLTTVLLFLCRIDYSLNDELVFEINSEKKVLELFSKLSGAVDNEEMVDTSHLGDNSKMVSIYNIFGASQTVEVNYKVVDTTSPVIEGEDSIELFKNDSFKINDYYKISDNSLEELEVKTKGECDTTIVQECGLEIVAKDSSGNEAKKNVVIKVVVDPEIQKIGKNEYYIKVNREQNVVMVYALDRNGEYTKLAKTFVSSVGKVGSETIVGTYNVSDRFEALYLVGNVWGHYAVRINGRYFFHSVPYFTKGNPSWNNLEYLEYNKLGEGASAGCVRLAVRDAKWVYENIPAGTTVEIFDSDTLPEGVSKPEAIKIDENSENRGWDPTDADPENPWNSV